MDGAFGINQHALKMFALLVKSVYTYEHAGDSETDEEREMGASS